MRETDGPDWPVQSKKEKFSAILSPSILIINLPAESSDTDKIMSVPETYKSVCTPYSKIFAGRVELNADTVRIVGMCLNSHQLFPLWPTECECPLLK